VSLTATLLLTLSSTAWAEEAVKTAPTGGGTTGWVLNGGNVGTGSNVLLAELGWPGLSLTILHGQSSRLDLGGTLGFDYGLEGVPVIAPGLKLNAVIRLGLADSGKYNVGVRVSPGLRTWFPTDSVHYRYFQRDYRYRDGDVLFGLQFPVELIAGILPTPSLSVNVALSLPMALYFVPEVSFVFPIQPGLGLEYRVDRSLTLTVDTRFGPSIFMVPGGSHAQFSFRTMLGLAYRL
jgi:hypothetical protein